MKQVLLTLALIAALAVSTVMVWAGSANCDYCGEKTETMTAGGCTGYSCTYPHCNGTTLNKTCDYDHGNPGNWVNCTKQDEADCRRNFWDCTTTSGNCF